MKTRFRSTQHVVAFESELRQVVSNLVNNAVDVMKALPRRLLTIRTREAAEQKSGRTGVVLTIADTGSGMPEEVKADIFKAFYSTKGHSGTGLGLWVSRGIVDRHHGTMSFRSSTAEGKSGTVFQLFLPFHAATDEGEAEVDSWHSSI